MVKSGNTGSDRGEGFLTRLANDRRGNTMAMMAAFLIPLSALAGSAIDIARLYVVKVRLQQACDAGVLAGRKSMVDATAATLDNTAKTQANAFFANNFKAGWMQTTAVSFLPSKTSNNQVTAIANATVPMTIMKMFGFKEQPLAVTCTARYDVADTDILFVLDTTASMACLPGGPDSCGMGTYNYTRPGTAGIPGYKAVPGYAGTSAVATNELTQAGKNVSRMEALRQAVLSFYDAFAAAADTSTHVRYGFVTYASSVNVGQAILDKSSAYMVGANGAADTAFYQTRHVVDDYVSSISDSGNNYKSQSNCNAAPVRSPATDLTYTSNGTATNTYDYWKTTGNSWNRTSYCVTRTETLGPQFKYERYGFNVSPLIAGNADMADPTKVKGDRLQWAGCVETPVQTSGQSSFVTASPPPEISPDTMPSSGSDSRWWPHLADVEYPSRSYSGEIVNGDTRSDMSTSSYQNSGSAPCGKPAKRLGVMSRSDVYNFVYANDFVPEGGTYHDTGMIWGARLISPLGAWSGDTQPWPDHGNQPNRVIVFMTDGIPTAYTTVYSMYGYEALDKRVANGDSNNLVNYHINRFLAACAAAKDPNHKISIWTVEIASAPSSIMQNCATSNSQALATTTGQGLQDAFASIAQNLAMLRITQ